MNNLFAGLISSKTRIKLLIRFFFNPGTKAYLRELSKEFNTSTNAVREELNQLTKTKLLTLEKEGRREFISYARQKGSTAKQVLEKAQGNQTPQISDRKWPPSSYSAMGPCFSRAHG